MNHICTCSINMHILMAYALGQTPEEQVLIVHRL